MTIQELIHAFGIGIDENKNPIELKYLIELLKQWTV